MYTTYDCVCVFRNITAQIDVYICMCVSSQQNSIETHNLSFLKNLSEDVIILSMPNTADDTGIVAVFLFGYVGDEIYMNIYIYICIVRGCRAILYSLLLRTAPSHLQLLYECVCVCVLRL